MYGDMENILLQSFLKLDQDFIGIISYNMTKDNIKRPPKWHSLKWAIIKYIKSSRVLGRDICTHLIVKLSIKYQEGTLVRFFSWNTLPPYDSLSSSLDKWRPDSFSQTLPLYNTPCSKVSLCRQCWSVCFALLDRMFAVQFWKCWYCKVKHVLHTWNPSTLLWYSHTPWLYADILLLIF